MRAVHPGEVLREDFPRPAGLAANALAKALRVHAPRINDIVRERRGVTADTAMPWARYFGGDAQSWLNLQTQYDLRIAEKARAIKIDREVRPPFPRGVHEGVPPRNRLEALHGDREGQHSIRVNDQWRICFRWTPAGPEDVEIVDYH